MQLRLLGEGGGAQGRLIDHLGREFASHADLDGAVDHGLKDEEEEAGPRAAHGRRHVDVALVWYVKLNAQGLEDTTDGGALFVVDLRSCGPDGHPFPDLGGGVGHDTDQGAVPQLVSECADIDAGHD